MKSFIFFLVLIFTFLKKNKRNICSAFYVFHYKGVSERALRKKVMYRQVKQN